VFLYECETLSLTLRKEQRRKVFVNNVLGKILGPEGDEVTGGWRKLHNEELYDLYFSPNIIHVVKSRIMGWMGCVACMGDRRGAYRLLLLLLLLLQQTSVVSTATMLQTGWSRA